VFILENVYVVVAVVVAPSTVNELIRKPVVGVIVYILLFPCCIVVVPVGVTVPLDDEDAKIVK
jgi:hypothetical protein